MTMTPLRRRLLIGGGVTLSVCLGVGLAGAGIANAETPAASPSASASAGAHVRPELRAIMHALPSELRKDVRAAEHHHSRDERKAALATIRTKVAAGGYGDTAKSLAADVQAEWSSLPAGAQHRLTSVADGRRDAVLRRVRTMLHRALVGKDGHALQSRLESLASGLPAAPAGGHAKESSGS